MPGELEILNPDILVTQGAWAKTAIEQLFDVRQVSAAGEPDYRCAVVDIRQRSPSLWIHTHHPTAFGLFNNQRGRQLVLDFSAAGLDGTALARAWDGGRPGATRSPRARDAMVSSGGVVGDIETPRRACTSRVSDLEGHRLRGAPDRLGEKVWSTYRSRGCLVRERAFEDGPKKVRDTRCPAGTRPRLCTSFDARMARPSRAVQSDHRFAPRRADGF